MKKTYTPKQKASIAISALKGEPLSKLSSAHQVHAVQIGKWRKLIEDEAPGLFADKRKKENHSKDRVIEELYKIIGQRDIELSWLKKKSGLELPREINFD
jgi:transposase-like protein